MISRFTVLKVLTDLAIVASDDIEFIPEGVEFEPKVGASYIVGKLRYGANLSIGNLTSDSDMSRGVYTLTVYTPRVNTGGNWQAISITDKLNESFPKFTKINDTPRIVLRETILSEMKTNEANSSKIGETHNSLDLDIRFTVIG